MIMVFQVTLPWGVMMLRLVLVPRLAERGGKVWEHESLEDGHHRGHADTDLTRGMGDFPQQNSNGIDLVVMASHKWELNRAGAY